MQWEPENSGIGRRLIYIVQWTWDKKLRSEFLLCYVTTFKFFKKCRLHIPRFSGSHCRKCQYEFRIYLPTKDETSQTTLGIYTSLYSRFSSTANFFKVFVTSLNKPLNDLIQLEDLMSPRDCHNKWVSGRLYSLFLCG